MTVVGLAAVLVAGFVSIGWSLPLWLSLGYLLFVFRQPRPVITTLPLAVVSPAGGRVDAIEEDHDRWLDRKALRIGIRLPFPGIAVLRSPIAGKVQRYWTDLDATGDSRDPPGMLDSPTCYALWIEPDVGGDVVYAVSSTWPHSRFKIDVAPGERTGKGQRGGFVYFASRVDVLVPMGTEVGVNIGRRVSAGSGIIAALNSSR